MLKMIPVGGITCCLSAAVLYILGRRGRQHLDVLKSIPQVKQLKELDQLLDASSKALPLIVSVSGRVGSDTPIDCEYSGLQGVIVEQKAEQQFLKHTKRGWKRDSALILAVCKEVPWYLDDGTSRVDVVEAHGATVDLVLTEKIQVFDEECPSLVRRTLEFLQGLRMLGVRRIERVLATGTPLTVVGEAVKDDSGSIQIQRPYVFDKTIDQLIANLPGKGRSRLYMYASMGFTVYGVYLVVEHAVQYIKQRRRNLEMRKRVLAAAAKKVEGAETGSDMMPDLCVICLEQDYNSVLIPCGHMCCCMACSSRLSICPLCRRRIKQRIRMFRH